MSDGGWSWTTRALFSVQVVAWGLNYLFVKVGLTAAGPLWLAFLRASIGCVGTAVLVLAYSTGNPMSARDRRDAILLGVPNTGAFLGLWFVAAETVLPGLASVLIYTFPLWVALLSSPILGHRLDRRHWVAVVVGFVGVALVVQIWELAGSSIPPLSVVMLLGAAFSWAIGTVLFQRRFGASHAVEGSAWGLLGGTTFLGVLLAILGPTPLPAFGRPELWESALWMGVIGTAVAYAIWYTLLSRTRAATLSAYVFLVPVVALTASALAFGERLDLLQLAGVALVVVSLYGIGRAPGAGAPPRPERPAGTTLPEPPVGSRDEGKLFQPPTSS